MKQDKTTRQSPFPLCGVIISVVNGKSAGTNCPCHEKQTGASRPACEGNNLTAGKITSTVFANPDRHLVEQGYVHPGDLRYQNRTPHSELKTR